MISLKKVVYSFSLSLLLILLVFVAPLGVYAQSTTEAKEFIDVDKKVDLSIKYEYEDLKLNNVDVKMYYVASVSEDFQYKLSSDFSKYSIKLNGIKNDSDWNNVKQTLEAYVVADKIDATVVAEVKDNMVVADDLKTGLYLVVTENIDEEDYILQFDSFLISLPFLNENGYYDYEVKAEPKPINYEPKFEDVTYSVVKVWHDDCVDRPTSVEIEIFKDGEFVEKQVLSSENSWTHTWDTIDDGSQWVVVERNVPEGYHVFTFVDGSHFTVVNSLFVNPGTSDNITGSVLVFVIALVVLMGVGVYLVAKKRN